MSEKMNSEFRDLWVAYCEQKEEVAALTEQVATLTARLTELEGADIALEDAIAEMRRMRDERDEWKAAVPGKTEQVHRLYMQQRSRTAAAEQRITAMQAEWTKTISSQDAIRIAAEATVDRYKVALYRIAGPPERCGPYKCEGLGDKFEPYDCVRCISRSTLTGTEPGEGTDVPPPSH